MALSSTGVRFDFYGRDVSAGRTARDVEGKFSGLQRTAAGVGRGMKLAAAVGATAFAGLATAGVSMGIKTASGLQQAQIGFETMLGSAKNAQDFLSKLKKFAAATPFELPGLIDSSRILLGVGVSAQKVIPMLTDFGDAAGALGIQQDGFQRIMIALSQSISAGTIKLGDMNQLMNNGLPIWKLMSEAMGKPVPELQKMISKGQLLTKDVLPKLQLQMHKDYGGAMAKQSQTLSGLWSTFMDTLNLGLADSLMPLVPILQKILPGAMTAMSNALGTVSRGIAAFIGWAGDMVPKVKAAFDTLKTFIPRINYSGLRKDASTGIQNALAGLSAKLPRLDLSAVGNQFRTSAERWASSIVAGLQTGIKKGNWGPLGQTLGDAVGKMLGNTAVVTGKLTIAIGKWFASIDWFNVGVQAGKQSFPFAIGFVSHMTDNLLKTAKEHPWDTAFAALMFLGVGRLAGKVGEFLKETPFKMLAPFFKAWGSAAKPFNAVIDWFFMLFRGGARKALNDAFPVLEKVLVTWLRRLGDDIALRAMYMRDSTIRMLQGIPRGIGYMTARVLAEITKFIGRMLARFAGAAGWLVGRGRDLVTGFIRGMAGRFPGVTSLVGSLIRGVTAPFRAAGSWLIGSGRNLISGLLGGVRSAMGGIGGWVKGVVVDPIINAVKRFFGIHSPSTVMAGIGGHLMSGLLRGMLRNGAGSLVTKVFGSMPKALGAMVNKSLISIMHLPMKALRAIGGMFGNLFGGGGGGAGVQRWAPLVVQALGMLGQPTSLLGAVLSRMNRESGGNPRAINLWDSNAQKGTPSIGLMQTIGPTFNAYAGPFRSRGIYDPFANIYAGLNYALHRYGSLEYAMTKPGGYRKGGRYPGRRLSVVGEDGPELFYDDKAGTIIPNARTYGGGGSGGVTLVVNINGAVAGSQVQMENMIGSAVDSLRRKGKLKLAAS